MKNKIVIAAGVLFLLAAFFIHRYKSGPSYDSIPSGADAKQIMAARDTLKKSDATEAEVYEALDKLAANQDETALNEAIERSNHESRMVREGAARALGYFANDRAFEGLKKLLSDPEENVRIRTLQALINAPEPRRLTLISEHILTEKATTREKTIGHAVLIKLLPDTDAAKKLSMDFLVDFVAAGDGLEEYIAFSKLIEAASKDAKVLELVRNKVSADKNDQMTALGIRHLASVKDTWIVSRISAYLKNKSPDVRAAAEQGKSQLAGSQ